MHLGAKATAHTSTTTPKMFAQFTIIMKKLTILKGVIEFPTSNGLAHLEIWGILFLVSSYRAGTIVLDFILK